MKNKILFSRNFKIRNISLHTINKLVTIIDTFYNILIKSLSK